MNLFHFALLFFGGFGAGLYASSVGVGGLFTLPLLLLTGLPIHIALGTQRFAAVILELASSIKFSKEKKVNFTLAIPLGIIAGLGSIIGVTIVIAINEKYLNIIIAILLVVIFIILKNKNKFGLKEHVLTHKHYLLLAASTFLLGIWGGFFGPGFGAFSVMLLVFFGFTFIESAAVSRVIGVFMSGVAMIVFAQHGFINYVYGATLGAGFAIGSWIGIGIALKKGDTFVRGLLVIVIVITVLKLVLNSFNITII